MLPELFIFEDLFFFRFKPCLSLKILIHQSRFDNKRKPNFEQNGNFSGYILRYTWLFTGYRKH